MRDTSNTRSRRGALVFAETRRRREWRWGILPLLLLALAPLACGDATGPGGIGPLTNVVSASPVAGGGPVWRSLDVRLDSAAAVEVYYQPMDGGTTLRMRDDSILARHLVRMPRLIADTTYEFAVRTFSGGAVSDSVVRGTFTTDTLPAGLAAIDRAVEGTASFPLLSVGVNTPGFSGQILLQTDGHIVWYFESTSTSLAATPVPGSHDMMFIDNGRNGVDRVSPDGQLVDFLSRDVIPDSGRIHHDITLPDADHVLMIQTDFRTVDDTVVKGDAIWQWTMSTDEVKKVWSAWDVLDWKTDRLPSSMPNDWLHTNSLSIGPAGNVIVSFFGLDQVISLSPDLKTVQWRLGGPNHTIGVSQEDAFIHQHSVVELPDGHVLLFDNDGGGPVDDHARGLELALQGDTAVSVLDYDPSPPLVAPKFGGAYELPNGDALFSFPSPTFTIDEVTAAGQRVWRLTSNDFGGAFRGVPWPSVDGEEEVAAMP